MPLGLQHALNRFQFERTVDWRVRFPNLIELIPNSVLKEDFSKYGFFAKSVTLPSSLVEVDNDPQLVGFFQSKLVQPTLTIDLFTDGEGLIESALRIWNRAAFSNEGYMPQASIRGDKSYAAKAVQEIHVDRINPVNMDEVKASFESTPETTANLVNYKKLLEYRFLGYLARLPNYTGQNSASIRTVNIEVKVVSMQMVVHASAHVSSIESSLLNAGENYKNMKDAPNKDLALDFQIEPDITPPSSYSKDGTQANNTNPPRREPAR